MGPIDYTLDVQNPIQSVLQGYQAGAAIRNDQLQQQQQQAAAAQQQRQQQMLAELANKPNATADDYVRVMTQIPSIAEQLQKAWTTKNAAQQQAEAGDMLRWSAAIETGNAEIAAKQMEERAAAMESSSGNGQSSAPTQSSQALRAQAQIVRNNPQFALAQFKATLAFNPNGKDAAETLKKFGEEQRAQEMQPAAMAKAGAEAQKSAIDAKYAEQNAIQEIQKRGWDIRAIQEDIGFKKEANRIALMNAALGRETNDLKRQEMQMQIQERRQALDEKIRTKVADAESSAAIIDNTLNTIERLKKNPRLNSVVGSLEGGKMYANTLMEMITPGGDSDVANDAIRLIDQLGSQAFLSQAANLKGMGALSNAEGEKLQAALANLDRKQSEKQFRESLDEVSRLMNKARQNISRRTGVPLGKPDTPAAPGARPPLESFEGVGRVGGQ
jgi:hypothetical protein